MHEGCHRERRGRGRAGAHLASLCGLSEGLPATTGTTRPEPAWRASAAVWGSSGALRSLLRGLCCRNWANLAEVDEAGLRTIPTLKALWAVLVTQ